MTNEPRPQTIRFALHWQILLGLVVGATAGLIGRAWLPPDAAGQPDARLAWVADNLAQPVGQVFLRLILMVVVPLVFSALVLGVVGVGDVRKLGRLGLRTLAYTLVLSGVSVAIAAVLTNGLRPGSHLPAEQVAELQRRFAGGAQETVAQARQAKPLRETLLDLIPKNPLQEAVGALDGSSPGGGMLAVMAFAVAFGVALVLVPERTGPLRAVLEGLYDVVMQIMALAMRLAPLGVAGLVFSLTALLGREILQTLAWYVLTVLCGLALQMFGVYSLAVSWLGRMNPWKFLRCSSDATLTALATSSSNATLPTSLRVAEEKLGVSRKVASFVLTVGSSANQNGTALYEGVTVLFLAQVFGLELSWTQQLTVLLMAVLAGVGTAGVPGGSLPLVVLLLQSAGIPGEAIGIILGVDRLLDMCRSSVNVAGDMAIAVCVDRAERAVPGQGP
jgi:DAACS family dicarboxylate/amino acid:cation (Na+ or H+) symporter